MTLLKKILGQAIIGYLGFLMVVFVFQRSFLYHPHHFDDYDTLLLQRYDALVLNDNDLKWLLLPAKTVGNRLLIYFHGNAGSAIDRMGKAEIWRDHGYDVILAEYPGYGVNKGKPSEYNFYNAGRVIINKSQSLFPNAKTYIYGESIGSGTAVQMATEYDIEALILEAAFSSLEDVVWSKLPFIPVSLMLKDKYNNLSKINNIQTSLIMVHGQKDNVVRYDLGRKIFDAYDGKKKWISVPNASHNDVYSKVNMADFIKSIELK